MKVYEKVGPLSSNFVSDHVSGDGKALKWNEKNVHRELLKYDRKALNGDGEELICHGEAWSVDGEVLEDDGKALKDYEKALMDDREA